MPRTRGVPVKEGETDKEKLKIFRYNETIKDILDESLGVIIPLDPEFDSVLEVTKHQSEKLGKPFAVFRRVQEIGPDEIDQRLKDIITKSTS